MVEAGLQLKSSFYGACILGYVSLSVRKISPHTRNYMHGNVSKYRSIGYLWSWNSLLIFILIVCFHSFFYVRMISNSRTQAVIRGVS